MSGRETLTRRYTGAFVLLCIVLGGGTRSGLTSDFILQIAAIPLIVLAVLDREIHYPKPIEIFLLAVVGLQFIQFAPQSWGGPEFSLVTRDIGRSIDLLVFTIVFASLFLVLGKLSEQSLIRLAPFVILGLTINVALAFVQFSSTRALTLDWFPFRLAAGFYANQNHFSALLFVCIPVLIAFFWARNRLGIALGGIVILIFLEFVAGSSAGIFLSMACAAATVWVLRLGERGGAGRYLVLVASAVFVLLAFNFERVFDDEITEELAADSGRLTFAANTLKGIWAYLPFGSGLGTFPIIYPQFEPVSQIDVRYVNHAHNDYLELLLEWGILAAALIAAFFGLLIAGFRDARRSKLKMSALCGIVFVLVHALVDYPLRTMGVASVFVFLNALYFVPLRETFGARQDGTYYLARRSPTLLTPS